MGVFLNPGAEMLRIGRRSQIYVDKSAIIHLLNGAIDTERRFVCVSRPRRFGKSMAANMICAYYDRTVDGAAEFAGLAIADDPQFDEFRNRYDVIHVTMTDFLREEHSVAPLLAQFSCSIIWELTGEYSDLRYFDPDSIVRVMQDIYAATHRKFVIVIDEWDCIMREHQQDADAQKAYLDFLRSWLKDKPYVALAYMTGILPIKKYGKHSALNMFSEYSMTEPREFAPTMGFTTAEVQDLCRAWHMPYDETRAWYDGYRLLKTAPRTEPLPIEIYSPKSIVESMVSGAFGNYWNKTETFEALKVYIDMNYEGLRDAVIALMAGDRRRISTESFVNDMTTFSGADDVLTLLVHLGYLAYDQQTSEVFVPNREVAAEFATAVSAGGWDEVARAIKGSEALLAAIVAGDEGAVASGVERAHQETSHLTYNDENALAYTLSLGLYAARQWYTVVRELPSGKGFADLVQVPRRAFADRPAIVVELKWDKDAQTALDQIRAKRYPEALEGWMAGGGELVLAGVSYDRKTRAHRCRIERMEGVRA